MDVEDLYLKFRECGKVFIGTRTEITGCMFFVLRNQTNNVSELVKEALDNGCRYVVCDENLVG